jgi:hypothetical protein
MSVLSQPYAVPSRVLGIYRYLLRVRGQHEAKEDLVSLLAPESLPRKSTPAEPGEEAEESGGKDMVRKTLSECVAMGLLTESDGEYQLNSDLPKAVRKEATAEEVLPVTLATLFFDQDRVTNHDLGLAIAWYLCQDAYGAPHNWNTIDAALREQVGGDRFGVTNSTPYGMFEDWVCYLGFGWTHALKDKTVLTPDPTEHLRRRLPELFGSKANASQSFVEVTDRLAVLCPVFEAGFLRNQVESQLRPRDTGQLSSATALAWLRLRDEGLVRLTRESDANLLVLPDGDRREAVSHIAWLKPA